MNNNNSVFIGTELKLGLHIEPIGNITMDDYDFEVEVFTSTKKVATITKADCIKDANSYIMLIDTSELGVGEIKCKVTAHIPDAQFDDGFRDEVLGINTGIFVTKDYE